MSEGSMPTHVPTPPPYTPKGFFDYTPPPFLTKQMVSREYLADFCKAIYYAGTTLYLWNEVPELKVAFLSACGLQKGQAIFLVSQYGAESGLTPALKSLIGESGSMTVQEIGPQAVDVLNKLGSAPGTKLQWDFNYLNSLPERSLDRIILFGAASHVANWDDFAREIHRVLRVGGRVIIAEAALGGKKFRNAMHMDSHCEAQISMVLAGVGIKEEELPNIEAEELTSLFQPFLDWSHAFSCDDLYVFYGQKGKGELSLTPPESTEDVQTFLKTRLPLRKSIAPFPPCPAIPFTTAWDFLAEPERAVWGQKIEEIKKWSEPGRPDGVAFLPLPWIWHNNRQITDIMFTNLMARPGDKVLLISEKPEDIVKDELRRRVGESGKIVYLDLISFEECDFKDWPEKRKKYMSMGIGEEWPYDFADNFPNDHFDLIFLPQGIHHSNNWLRDAPRLLRALKPGGQVMAIECGLMRPEWFIAREESALARVILDRIYESITGDSVTKATIPVPPECRHEGRPYHDVSVAHLREAFGDALVDVAGIEWKGWILFWGYKK